MKDDQIKKELEDLAPILADLKNRSKADSDQLPDGYFEDFQSQFWSQVKQEKEESPKESQSPKVIRMHWRIYAVAASFALLLFAFWGLVQDQSTVDGGFASLSDELLLEYIDEHLEEYDASDIYSMSEEALGEDLYLDGADTEYLEEEVYEDDFLDALDYEDLL